jgi:hypothetical protein
MTFFDGFGRMMRVRRIYRARVRAAFRADALRLAPPRLRATLLAWRDNAFLLAPWRGLRRKAFEVARWRERETFR